VTAFCRERSTNPQASSWRRSPLPAPILGLSLNADPLCFTF
jgi:hypothetical protein